MYFYDILELTPIIMPRTENKGGQKKWHSNLRDIWYNFFAWIQFTGNEGSVQIA